MIYEVDTVYAYLFIVSVYFQQFPSLNTLTYNVVLCQFAYLPRLGVVSSWQRLTNSEMQHKLC